jgi:glycosyltransferase involved in cell wall biosynthesis
LWPAIDYAAVHILIVNYEFPPLGGGGGILTRTLVAELARGDEHDVTVITSRGPGQRGESFEEHARVVRVPILGRRDPNRASLLSLLSFGPAARRVAARVVGSRHFDVVHTFFAVPSGPAGASIARRAGAPHVLTVIGADIHDPTRSVSPDRFPPMRGVVRRVVRGAAAVVAISTDVADRTKALTGRDDVVVIGCALPDTLLPPRERREEGPIVFVTIARLVARKSLAAVVAAVPEGARLIVIGDGPEREALERASAPGRVEFTGALDDAGKNRRLVDADAFVLVSHHEGFGLVYLEAMRAGLPVIAGTVGGQTDFLDDGSNAILVPPGDSDAISRAMRSLIADPALRKLLGEGGRASAARYTAAAMTEAYEAVYARAIAAANR